MAENRKSFWTTVPGIISGVAAIVTGLGVLIPLTLGLTKQTNKNSASQKPPPGVTSTSTAGGSTGDAASPLPSDGSPFPTDSSPGTGANPSGGLGITVDPSGLSFGSIQQGKSTPDKTVTITNPGSAPVTIDKVEITGSNAGAFSVTSNTCGVGSSLAAQQTCQVSLHFTPNQFGSASASLVVHYEPPQSAFTTTQLSGTGSLL